MTYVLATVRRGVSTILADSRVTSDAPGKSHDDMCKVGILFPGCTFGVAGSDQALRRFVSEFQRNSASGRGDINGDWDYFQKYCAGYGPTKERFKVVLSERTTGIPRLHLYDSYVGKLVQCGDLVTLGSGTVCFDEPIKHYMAARLDEIDERLIEEYGNNHLFPNFLCLVLLELVQGEHAEDFRKHVGIGGVFHYLIQGSDFERLQVPSVYLIVWRDPDKDRRAFTIHPFRICGTRFGLTIQGPPPFDWNNCSLHLDASKQWNVNWSDRLEADRFIQGMLAEFKNLPFYNFLGVGFAHEKYRDTVLIDTKFSENYVWTPGKQMEPNFKSQIDRILSERDSIA